MTEPANTKQQDQTAEITILLVEDYDSDAHLISMELAEQFEKGFRIERTSDLKQTLDWLRSNTPDAVLLDMNLGDSTGVDTIRAVIEAAGDAAIIVITGHPTSEMASHAIELGAQDFVDKRELTDRSLKNILSFAVARRQAELRRIEQALDHYRDLADPDRPDIDGVRDRPLAEYNRALYDESVSSYRQLIHRYLDNLAHTSRSPLPGVRELVTKLGNAGAGPRDVIDIHVKVLGEEMQHAKPTRARHLNTDGRLLALETLGRLASYYRQRLAKGSQLG